MVTGKGKDLKLQNIILPQLELKAWKKIQWIVNMKMWIKLYFCGLYRKRKIHANNWNSSTRQAMILHGEVNEGESDFTASTDGTHC